MQKQYFRVDLVLWRICYISGIYAFKSSGTILLVAKTLPASRDNLIFSSLFEECESMHAFWKVQPVVLVFFNTLIN